MSRQEHDLQARAEAFRQGDATAPVFQYAADILALRAELAASESLVTALQEQMARLAEQHAKAVAEAREEQREACALRVDDWYDDDSQLSREDFLRATPLDSTPLAARIAELEAAVEEAETMMCNAREERDSAEAERQHVIQGLAQSASKRLQAESALAAEVERHQATAKNRDALAEALAGTRILSTGCWCSKNWKAMERGEHTENCDKARAALASLPAGPREDR